MERVLKVVAVVALGVVAALPNHAWAKKLQFQSCQTYTVTVGWEDAHKGIGINAFFPEAVTVRVGDTVRWEQNSNEIHTVTFLDGMSMPDLIIPGEDSSISPLMFNPRVVDPCVPADGQYKGGFANSGLMGREPGQARQFCLTFATEGTFEYVCVVHGTMMSGQVTVVAADQIIPMPMMVKSEGMQQLARLRAEIPNVVCASRQEIQPSQENWDGTETHYVTVGYAQGQIDLMQFIPDRLNVRPGDTIVWQLSATDMAPHTVTFLNGQSEPELVIPVGRGGQPPLLYLNPEVIEQRPEGSAGLTRAGYINSGLLVPGIGPTGYVLNVRDISPGPLPYLCLLHDASGMKADLTVLPENSQEPCEEDLTQVFLDSLW
jgi:plastocyanin